MSSFAANLLPRIAARTVVCTKPPRLCRFQSLSLVRRNESSSSAPSSTPTEPHEDDDVTEEDFRRTHGLAAPDYIPAWPTAPKPTADEPSLSSSLVDLLTQDPSSSTATPNATASSSTAISTATATSLDRSPRKRAHIPGLNEDPSTLSPAELALVRHRRETARVSRLPPPERALARSSLPDPTVERKRLERHIRYSNLNLNPAQIDEQEQIYHQRETKRKLHSEIYAGLTAEEKYEWKVAEQERVKTEGMNEKDKAAYLTLARHNRNLNKLGLAEVERRREEKKKMKKQGGPKREKREGPKEDKRKGVHSVEERAKRQQARADGPKPGNTSAATGKR